MKLPLLALATLGAVVVGAVAGLVLAREACLNRAAGPADPTVTAVAAGLPDAAVHPGHPGRTDCAGTAVAAVGPDAAGTAVAAVAGDQTAGTAGPAESAGPAGLTIRQSAPWASSSSDSRMASRRFSGFI